MWIVVVGLACVVVRAIDRRGPNRSIATAATVTGAVMAIALMAAISVVWRLEQVDGRTPPQAAMDLLRLLGDVEHVVAVDLTGRRRLESGDLVPRMELRLTPAPRSAAFPREDRALFTLPQVPAGEYRLRAERAGGSGWLMAGAGVGRDQFALVTEPVESFDRGVPVRVPVDLRVLIVRGDEGARAQVRALFVRPVSIRSRDQKASSGMARRAVRYGRATAFFMDDRSFPEPGGFWLGGGRESAVVLQPEHERGSIVLELRNAPVDNVVTVRAGGWIDTLRLTPGEERRVELPPGPPRSAWGAMLVTFEVSSGFRPSAVDAASRDTRFLGAWVRVE